MGPLSLPEMLLVLGIAVLLFGKRLPEVGRSLGKGIVEFKKGMRGIEEELHGVTRMTTSEPTGRPVSRSSYDFDPAHSADAIETTVPKFELPTEAPIYEPSTAQPDHSATPQFEPEPQPYQD